MAKKATSKSTWTIIIVIAVIVVIGYFMFNNPNKPTTTAAGTDPEDTGGGSGGTGSGAGSGGLQSVGADAPLSKGSKGSEVKALQNYYNVYIAGPKGLTKLTEDGIFGSKTEAAVESVTGLKTISLNQFKNMVTFNSTNENGAFSYASTEIADTTDPLNYSSPFMDYWNSLTF